ncbi:hypothetical protein pdam_00012808, partial [Pocillopora damicornis]
GHVNWDTAVPANLGYMASILWNQNNCAAEGGPATTGYEVQVGGDLCEMVGLNRDTSLGHLVAGGSVANIEAIWVARNLKYYALGLQEALLKEEQLRDARDYEIHLPQNNTPILLINATQWELLNLDTDIIIKMPSEVATLAKIDQAALRKILADYLYESIGAQEFCNRHMLTTTPCVVVASTYHVSLLKAVTITVTPKAAMFNPRKKTSRKVGKEEQKRKGKAPMFTHRRGIFSKRAVSDDVAKPWAAVGTWFLGPKAENADVFIELMKDAIKAHMDFRQGFYPCDPPYVTDELRQAESFKKSYEKMKTELDNLQKDIYFPCDPPYVTDELREAASFKNSMEHLKTEVDNLQKDLEKSVPFFSSRYKNNCAAEASTVTTKFEVEVGKDLCIMMGYDGDKAMGHLTAGGSVANIEAIWAGRNVKYFPLGLQEALLKEEKLAAARGYKITFPQRGGEKGELQSASQWELLNLDVDTILRMPKDVEDLTGLQHQDFMGVMGQYLYESVGAQEFARRHMLTQSPCVIVPSTAHISLTKAVTILGLGRESLVTVAVDEDARMEPKDLERVLQEKLKNEIPVITVVSVMGTTEESAGLCFSLHADGAWGGYFCSMLRDPKSKLVAAGSEGFVPELWLSPYVKEQLSAMDQCDTITIDPHKSGFCPYPAGALCYRDKLMNTFLQITTTVVYYHGDMTLGDIGIEGSKPGAAAAGVMLANRQGYLTKKSELLQKDFRVYKDKI